MAQKVIILIEDDWELRGNGLGNVAHLQYLPLLFLTTVADELGLKITFMVEVLQQLTMCQHAHRDRNLMIQTELWRECVLLMKEHGHDVQLHIHPQWHHAAYEDGCFRLGQDWNIATHDRSARRWMIAQCRDYLDDLVKLVDPDHTIHSFKAGSWGLQPSREILEDLGDHGIEIVIGPGWGIRYHSERFHCDYSELQERTFPYYPDYDDICRVSESSEGIVVLPLPYYVVNMTSRLLKNSLFLAEYNGFSVYPLGME